MKLIVYCHRLQSLIVAVHDKIILCPLSHAESQEQVQFACSPSLSLSAVQCLALDPREEFLYAAFENKTLACWHIDTRGLQAHRTLRKKPTALLCGAFSLSDSLSLSETERETETERDSDARTAEKQVLLVSDKAGDVYAVRAPGLQRERVIAGHTASVVTDICLTGDGKHVITADRDEKLRISSFPDMESIEGFLLAHTSVVASVDTLQVTQNTHNAHTQQLALSSGWDHKLLLWDVETRSLLQEVSLRERETERETETAEEKATERETEREGEGEGEGETENDMIPEKEYNEKDAGNYPFKIIGNGASTAAVLRKDDATLSLYTVSVSERESTRSLSLTATVSLPAPPLDAVFLARESDTLAVLLPAPHMLRVYTVKGETASVRVREEAIAALKELAGDSFDQSVVSRGLGFEGESGMRKHLLDRPFNEEEHINFNAKKGSKRSRKN